MSNTTASLKRKISSAKDLQSVVRTMKALAASSIGQYEKSTRALEEYHRSIATGLGACFRAHTDAGMLRDMTESSEAISIAAVVFGSDQGLVGQFNDTIADYAISFLAGLTGQSQIWSVGERAHARLADSGLTPIGLFSVPNSVEAITPLVGEILLQLEARRAHGKEQSLYVFHHRPQRGSVYEPACQRLLPLDSAWINSLKQRPWPTQATPEIMSEGATTLRALIREYLFISLFRASAESLASENASRLAAMQRAEKNIEELLEALQGSFHRQRQSGIDEELFDVISGFEALSKKKKRS